MINIRIDEHKAKIQEIEQKLNKTSSVYSKRDLLKCLGKLKRQLVQCEHYLGERVSKCQR